MWRIVRRWIDWALLAAVIVWALSLAAESRRQNLEGGFVGRSLLMLVTPVLRLTDRLADNLSLLWSNQFEGARLRTANRELRAELDQARLDLVVERDLLERLQRVGADVEARRLAQTRQLILAEVIGYGRTPESGYLLIARGERDGVAEGQPVTHGDALVGVIHGRPAPRSATVLLLNDPASWIVVSVRDTRVQGVVRGRARADGAGLEFLPQTQAAPFAEGDELVTSGLSGLLFPGGLRVGRIEAIEINNFGQRVGRVRPAADLARIEEVVALAPRPAPAAPPTSDAASSATLAPDKLEADTTATLPMAARPAIQPSTATLPTTPSRAPDPRAG